MKTIEEKTNEIPQLLEKANLIGSISISQLLSEESEPIIWSLMMEVNKLKKENKILELKNKTSLANNLCPDHRDKIYGQSCLMCKIERLKRNSLSAFDQ